MTTTSLTEEKFYYVGIGASAGGQEALCDFFSHLPPDTAAAYFVITHLSRYHKSQLSEIIGRCTKMRVVSVDHAMSVQPRTAYFLIENTVMTVDDAGIVVQRRIEWEIINKAVNTFFISMARHHGRRAIGVILSGGGDDGVAGAMEITNHGGKVLVQDPKSSQFDGMPNATISKDHPAAILTPEALAKRVVELVNLPLQ
jgi:two-component system chemotaxis response regulator CheB